MLQRIRKKKKNRQDQLPAISDERIASLSRLLEAQIKEEAVHRRYAPVKHVLTMIGVAGTIGMTLISPGGAAVGKLVLDAMERSKKTDWRKYNPSYLRRTITRLQAQKLVEVSNDRKTQTVVLTEMGKRRILKYALDDLAIPKPKHWDGKWRMIIYDVNEHKKDLRDVFRSTLKALRFYQLQESTWIYPYPCESHVTFLREYYGVGNEVLYVIVSRLENDTPYRVYFGLEE